MSKTKEYLESVLEKARQFLPKRIFDEIHLAARAQAGGRSAGKTNEPSVLEKLALTRITPARLKSLSHQAIQETWLNLNEWFSDAKKKGRAIEDFVNAAVFVIEEMRRRKLKFDETLQLAQEAEELSKSEPDLTYLDKNLRKTPKEIMVVKDFVSIVGSVPRGKDNPADVDVLVRANSDNAGKNCLLQNENVLLPIRNWLDPLKKEMLHFISNAQGPHGDFMPVFDLVLRRRETMDVQVVKSMGAWPRDDLRSEDVFSPDQLFAIAALGYDISITKRAPKDEGGGETREDKAQRFFRDSWWKLLPKDGKGKFVYHHHWRGLAEEETKFSDDKLLSTDHSLHGDIRMEGDDGLWGWAVLLGKTSDNRGAAGDKMFSLKSGQSVRLSPKLQQPDSWLNVSTRIPFVTKPGEVGATSEAFAKFFDMDKGTYEMGYAKESFFEVFLKGGKLKGRYTIQRIRKDDGDVWTIGKPDDQTPFIEKNKLENEIKDQKGKGRKFIYWAKPGTEPRLINLASVDVEKVQKVYDAAPAEVPIFKLDDEKRIVYGIVLEPEVIDSQKDVISQDDIEKAAHFFMKESRVIGFHHKKKARADLVESYLSPIAFEIKGPYGTQKVKKGTWIIGAHTSDDETWKMIKEGKIQSFSVGGFGRRT